MAEQQPEHEEQVCHILVAEIQAPAQHWTERDKGSKEAVPPAYLSGLTPKEEMINITFVLEHSPK